MNKPPCAERRLSTSEKFWWVLEHQASVNFVMQARIRGYFSEGLLRAALDAVQLRHPLLRVRIVRQGRGHLSFDGLRVGPIPLMVVDSPLDSWTGIAEQELAKKFTRQEEGPLIRRVLIKHGPRSEVHTPELQSS